VSAKTKDIKIIYNSKKDSYIKGNKKQIDTLFYILIENAINYSTSDTEIQVIIKEVEGHQVYVGIKDQGIGIPEKNLNNILSFLDPIMLLIFIKMALALVFQSQKKSQKFTTQVFK